MAGEVVLRDNAPEARYELLVDGTLAAEAHYERRPGRVVFVHTEVGEAFRGRRLGDRLAEFALRDARDRGERVIARCPFIAAYVERHPEHQDIVLGRRPPAEPG